MSGDEVIEANAVSASLAGHSISIGDCIEVEKERRFGTADSEGGAGFVTGLNQDGTFNVRWVLSNRGEQNVRSSRLKSNNPLALSARRTSANSIERPSILCPSHRQQAATSNTSSALNRNPVSRHAASAGPKGVAAIILQSKQWSKFDSVPNPLLRYLYNGNTKRRNGQRIGWLRRAKQYYEG